MGVVCQNRGDACAVLLVTATGSLGQYGNAGLWQLAPEPPAQCVLSTSLTMEEELPAGVIHETSVHNMNEALHGKAKD